MLTFLRAIKELYQKTLGPFLNPVLKVLINALRGYGTHRVARLGAALAYYTIFSLPAVIIVIVGLVGFFLGEAAVQGEIYNNLVGVLGETASSQIENAVKGIGTTKTNWWAAMGGVSILIFVATGVFYVMQEALNIIFEVEQVPRKVRILEVIINRVLSLGMIGAVGGLLLLSIVLNAILLKVSSYISANEAYVVSKIPASFDFVKPYLDYLTTYFLVFLNMGLSIFLITLFFALLYKILPAVKIPGRYIFLGSFFSAVLFWGGEVLMGIYLDKTSMVSAYGAAGSLIIILLWVYYSGQLVFLGAELIRSICEYREVELEPKIFAEKLQTAHGRIIVEEEFLEEEIVLSEKSSKEE